MTAGQSSTDKRTSHVMRASETNCLTVEGCRRQVTPAVPAGVVAAATCLVLEQGAPRSPAGNTEGERALSRVADRGTRVPAAFQPRYGPSPPRSRTLASASRAQSGNDPAFRRPPLRVPVALRTGLRPRELAGPRDLVERTFL